MGYSSNLPIGGFLRYRVNEGKIQPHGSTYLTVSAWKVVIYWMPDVLLSFCNRAALRRSKTGAKAVSCAVRNDIVHVELEMTYFL